MFAEQARCVVILYRPEWGSTRWTRIEETAVRNRAHDQGYDFALFVPLHEPPVVCPVGTEKQTVDWIGTMGLASAAAAVIEARARELGAELHAETLEERTSREARRIQFEAEREKVLRWEQGAQAFQAMKIELFRSLADAAAQRANESQSFVKLATSETGAHSICWASIDGLSVSGAPQYANSVGEGKVG